MEPAGAGSVSSLLVFPGQGAQQPGMLQRLPRETLNEASDVLGEDVLQLDSAAPCSRPGRCSCAC
jgi:hypothetical protein